MESRLDLYEDTKNTANPEDKLILTRVREPMLGCGTAILLKFQRGEETICLGYCSPDELRFAMSGIGIVSLPSRPVEMISDLWKGLQPFGR